MEEEKQQTLPTPHEDARQDGASPEGVPPTTPVALTAPRLLDRRTLLLAGGGVSVLAGAAVVAKRYHILGRLRGNGLALPAAHAPHPQSLPEGPLSTPLDVVIFSGALANGWQNSSWGTFRVPDTAVTYEGKPVMSMELAHWSGLQLYTSAVDVMGIGYVQCWVRGADAGGQVANLWFKTPDTPNPPSVSLGDYTRGGGIAQGEWRLARVPMQALGVLNGTITGLVLQAGADAPQGTIQLADLRLVYHPNLAPPRIVRAWALDLGTITLAFDEPMQPESVAQAGAYLLAAVTPDDATYPPDHPVAATRARYHQQAHTVSLTVPRPLRTDGTYTVTVGSVADRFGARSVAGARASVRVTAQPLTLALDAAAALRPISKEIYGMAGVDADVAADLGVTLARWGGNAVTRYNWKLGNAFSAARDYNFQNGNYGATSPADRQPSGVADQQIATNAARGIPTLLTIPTIGWVARNDDAGTHSTGVPEHGGPPLVTNGDAIGGYDPTENRQRTCVPSRARKGRPFSDPPDLHDPTVAQDEWVNHLVRRFGRAEQGGVRYYAMDNEPDLWSTTHTDIRPAQLSYDQLRDIFLEYASAVKDVDPSAQITGPVSWGWTNYLYSPLDAGSDNYRSHSDRMAHQDMPLVAWWLSEIRRHDAAAGRRTLDVLDLHFYPQAGQYSDDVSAAMAALRLRSTRALWDPTYVDESWINDRVRLIPRMREWVDLSYPGTKIALTEWSWGAEGSINGALALADVLGIFGREGLDIACHWGALDASAPAYAAFKLYGNYDSAGSAFLGSSLAAHSTNADLLSCYAARQDATGTLLVMAVNKSLDSDLTPTLTLANTGAAALRRARVWRFWPDDAPGISRGPDVDLPASAGASVRLTYTFPASSITLLRLETGA